MRETVDEKLNSSLSQRLNDSFSKIQQSLESVNLGIGEMRNLANGVGDIKRSIQNAILQAKSYIVILTGNSINSKWVEEEIKLILNKSMKF